MFGLVLGIIKDNKLYFSKDKNIVKTLDNYTHIKNRGNNNELFITYNTKENNKISKDIIIGDKDDLIEFLINNRKDKIIIIQGFNKSFIYTIWKTVLEMHMDLTREKIEQNEEKIKILKKDKDNN